MKLNPLRLMRWHQYVDQTVFISVRMMTCRAPFTVQAMRNSAHSYPPLGRMGRPLGPAVTPFQPQRRGINPYPNEMQLAEQAIELDHMLSTHRAVGTESGRADGSTRCGTILGVLASRSAALVAWMRGDLREFAGVGAYRRDPSSLPSEKEPWPGRPRAPTGEIPRPCQTKRSSRARFLGPGGGGEGDPGGPTGKIPRPCFVKRTSRARFLGPGESAPGSLQARSFSPAERKRALARAPQGAYKRDPKGKQGSSLNTSVDVTSELQIKRGRVGCWCCIRCGCQRPSQTK
jgi:hypothetical protein